MVCFFKSRICFLFITKFPVKDSIVRNIIMNQRSSILCRFLWVHNRIKYFIIYFYKSSSISGCLSVLCNDQCNSITHMSHFISNHNRMTRLFHGITVLEINLPPTNGPDNACISYILTCEYLHHALHRFGLGSINTFYICMRMRTSYINGIRLVIHVEVICIFSFTLYETVIFNPFN